ncbi:sensor histidine kinase [Lentibacillus sp. N15]
MTLVLGYVYFSLFLAFYIGNIPHRKKFLTLYIVHLVTTVVAVGIGFFIQNDVFLMQLPFITISVIGVILLPFTIYNRNKRERLESQLKIANKKLSQMVVLEERQRIARDLHDTLGQKLSLIGLKSDLAGKLINRNPESASKEIADIHLTARTALKEVREMVSDMKGAKLEDEMVRVQEILKAAQIDFQIQGIQELTNIPPLVENVLSMCVKEAVTNVVKHSQARLCSIRIDQAPNELVIIVTDDGVGMADNKTNTFQEKNGLMGMSERLEFVNGSLDITSSNGTTLMIRVPNDIKRPKQGVQ